MSDNQDAERSEADADLEREIRNSRKFTLEEAIGRMAGPGAMKGESPIARKQQAELEIESCAKKPPGGRRGSFTSCFAPSRQGKRTPAQEL